MKKQQIISLAVGVAALSIACQGAFAACSDVTRAQLKAAAQLVKSDAAEQDLTRGLGNHMWVTMVDNTGKVCHIVNSAGEGQRSSQTWGISRAISIQKADTSALLSLNAVGSNPIQPWATGNLYLAAQPGGFLFGVQHSNPVDAHVAYAGSPAAYGTDQDPAKNKRIGGINVFGGGLPLYKGGKKIGAIGSSGDTSCTDQARAWRIRKALVASAGIDDANAASGDVVTFDNLATPELDGHPQCPAMPPSHPGLNGVKY
ncbi:MAG: GlcG/HbpS family heme-binding protein [Gammaproteobacteria bacterium]